ncbi:MAG: type VII secretion target [Mycobacterium sp.]
MGQQHVYVDSDALRTVADRFDAAAALIDGTAAVRLSRLTFDAASAGRAHAAGGAALRRAVDRWAGELTRWSRASAEVADALRTGVADYGDAERSAQDRVG